MGTTERRQIKFPRFQGRPQPLREAHSSWWDVWLPRINHLSQLGLLLSAVVAFFVTVIPLYQKALLEEAIARKEVELREATKLGERTYKRLKGYVVASIIIHTRAECASYGFPIEGVGKVPPQRPADDGIERSLQRDVIKCLSTAAMGTPDLDLLKPEDKMALLNEVTRIGQKLSDLQEAALKEVKFVPAMALVNPQILDPVFEDIERTMKSIGVANVQRDKVMAIRRLRGSIRSTFYMAISKELEALQSMDWPGAGPLEPEYRMPTVVRRPVISGHPEIEIHVIPSPVK